MSNWVLDVEAELNNRRNAPIEEEQGWNKRSIYKVPHFISELNEKACQPLLVSFGPYHHGKPHLKPMEDDKQRAFLRFLERSRRPFREIFNCMVEVAQDLMDSYDLLQSEWQKNTEEFVKLMIVDGCFMLEILHAGAQGSTCDYPEDDPIFGPHGKISVMPLISRDMLLLENQLPILVLFELKTIEEDGERDMEILNKLILRFYGHGDRDLQMGKCLHVLDVYRKSLLYEKPEAYKSTKRRKDIPEPAQPQGERGPLDWLRQLCDIRGLDGSMLVRSATELHEAGIRFKTSRSERLLGISFDGGVLRLPRFIIDEATESTFLSLVAFEWSHVGASHDFTSFLWFMDSIIDQDSDISLLSSKGIILNLVGTDKAAADLFGKMSKNLVVDPSSEINNVHKRIISYCRKPWHKWRAKLIHDYFGSPWSIISVVAAVILFAFATVSTVHAFTGK